MSNFLPAVDVPKGARVFLLEDNSERIAWFQRRIPELCLAMSADGAIRVLENYGPFDIMFLDHDLGDLDYEDQTRTVGNGTEVAQYIAEHNDHPGLGVLIHSWNREGAKRMKSYIKHASLAPFGQFEIARTNQ